jgi:hypothetical protein
MMDRKEFAELVLQMMTEQQIYFHMKGVRTAQLIKCKHYERLVREAAEEILSTQLDLDL